MYKPVKPENQTIGYVICPDCGKQTPVKLNKNGCLYIYCTNVVNEETGERCYARRQWGRKASREYIKKQNIEVINGNTTVSDIIRTTGNAGQLDFAAVWGN